MPAVEQSRDEEVPQPGQFAPGHYFFDRGAKCHRYPSRRRDRDHKVSPGPQLALHARDERIPLGECIRVGEQLPNRLGRCLDFNLSLDRLHLSFLPPFGCRHVLTFPQ